MKGGASTDVTAIFKEYIKELPGPTPEPAEILKVKMIPSMWGVGAAYKSFSLPQLPSLQYQAEGKRVVIPVHLVNLLE